MTQNNDNTLANTEKDKSSMEGYLGKDWRKKVTPEFIRHEQQLEANNQFEDAEKHLVDFYGGDVTGRNFLKSIGITNTRKKKSTPQPNQNAAGNTNNLPAAQPAAQPAPTTNNGQVEVAVKNATTENTTDKRKQEMIDELARLADENAGWNWYDPSTAPPEVLARVDEIFAEYSQLTGNQVYYNPWGNNATAREDAAKTNGETNGEIATGQSQGNAVTAEKTPAETPAETPVQSPAETNGETNGETATGQSQGQQMTTPAGLPSPNQWQKSEKNSTSTTTGTSDTNQQTTSRTDFDPNPQLAKQIIELCNAFPTAVSELFPAIKDDLDPEKIAEKKKGIAFRQGMHELLENMRVLSDIGASFAGGNAYKRNAPDYRRYEAERASVDKARKDALDMLEKAKMRDNEFLRNLVTTAFGKSWVSKSNQDTISNKTENKTQNENGTSVGYTRPTRNVTNNYNGRTPEAKKYWTAVRIVDENGNATGSKKIYFNSESDKNSFYDSLTKFVVGTDAGISDNALRNGADIGANTLLKQAFEWAQEHAGKSVSDLLNNNNIPIQDRFNYLRELIQGGAVYDSEGKEICKLTNQQRENILGSVILSEQQTLDLLEGVDYTLSDVEDRTSSSHGKNNSDLVRTTNVNPANNKRKGKYD